jgi:predicted transcriptional regulator
MPAISTISTTSVKLDKKIHERVQRLASARQQTPGSLIVEAIEQYVDRQEKREQFLKDGVAALEDYKATGLHLTGDEVEAWVTQLEAGENAPLPQCHR